VTGCQPKCGCILDLARVSLWIETAGSKLRGRKKSGGKPPLSKWILVNHNGPP
jgi:hypothetical protein